MADMEPQVCLPEDIEILNLEEEDEVLPVQYSVTSYGADYPVDALVRRADSGDIYIPDFQRQYVWNRRRASRFIESLLLGLPVPGIFLSRDEKTKQMLVIDGQQRIKTLQFFYDGVFKPSGREFSLQYLGSQWDGATYKTLDPKDRRRLDDSVIHATVIKQDEPEGDNSSIYSVFERLNTESDQLKPQEIRACIYHGEFNSLLYELNNDESWRRLFGPVDKRMRDQELILRFLALYFDRENYKKPMTSFLNGFMRKHQTLADGNRERFASLFANTVAVVTETIGSQGLRPKGALNAAVFDAAMVATASRLARGPVNDLEALAKAFDALWQDETFVDAVTRATSDEAVVAERLKAAISGFADVK